jgi:hypothetical protein
MEITNPSSDPNGDYYVTNGLLVREMVSGQIQEGDSKFRSAAASNVSVAGDPGNNPGPTYQSFKNVASLTGNNKATQLKGEVVKATLNREGVVGQSDDLGNKYAVKYAEYNPELGHNIPDVFWNFMGKQGLVYQNGQFVTAAVINWTSTMGFPLTEAYWSKVVVGGQQKDVLIQLYERRVLTYTPDNSEAYKVEMGNVGAHYYAWRYSDKERVAPYASLNVNNDTDCNPISMVLTGQDNLTVEIPARNTKTYKLGPGKYNYKVTGCGAIPLEDSETFAPNDKFNLRIYKR